MRGSLRMPGSSAWQHVFLEVGAYIVAAVQISGRALLGVLKYSKVLAGADGPGALIANLAESDRRVLVKTIRSRGWYPYSAYAGMLETIKVWPGLEHSDPLLDFGRWGLAHDAGSVLKILSVFSSVEGLVHRGFGSWGSFLWGRHCDTGEVFLADSGPKTGTMGLRGFPTISPAHCWMISGYLEAMGRSSGAPTLRMEKTRCIHRNDSCCEYRGEWD